MTPTLHAAHAEQSCCQCGYSLLGLDPAGVCPECGTSIDESLGFLLRRSDPAYLRAIARGLALILWSVALKCAVMLTALFESFGLQSALSWKLFMVACLGVWGAGWVGCLMITVEDPGLERRQRAGSMRHFTRILVTIHGLAIAMPAFASVIWTPRSELPDDVWRYVLIPLFIIVCLSGLLLDFSVMTYASWMARRLPDRRLRRHMSVTRWILPPAAALNLLGNLGLLGGAMLLGPLLYGVQMFRLRRHVKKQLENARTQTAVSS